jgi:hypothetical protein
MTPHGKKGKREKDALQAVFPFLGRGRPGPFWIFRDSLTILTTGQTLPPPYSFIYFIFNYLRGGLDLCALFSSHLAGTDANSVTHLFSVA